MNNDMNIAQTPAAPYAHILEDMSRKEKIAVVTFLVDSLPGIEIVEKGDDAMSYQKLDPSDLALNYVCIREAGHGSQPMFCAITNKSYKCPGSASLGVQVATLVYSKYSPSLSTAQTIHKILSKDWDMFVALFDEAGDGKLGKRPYWIDETHSDFLFFYVELFFYHNGDHYGCKTFWDGDYAPILVKMDYWIDEKNFNDGGSY